MARNYGTKHKVITFNTFWDDDENGATPEVANTLPLNSTNLGFDPRRRALYITISGNSGGDADMEATSFQLQVKGYAADGETAEWIAIPWEKDSAGLTMTGATSYIIGTQDDIMRVRPRDLRIAVTSVLGDGDPGTVIVAVTAKRVPSNMRDE